MKGSNSVRFGISSVEVVGVDELEEGLVVKELGEGVFRVRVGQLITGGLACAGMMEARKSADRVGYGSSRFLNDDLERKKEGGCQKGCFFRNGHELRNKWELGGMG